MQCSKCYADFDGNFCPKCGTPSNQSMSKPGILLGFRSRKGWKKIVAICYLIFWGLFIVVNLFSARQGKVSSYDYFVDKAHMSLITLIFLSPFMFLSNTKLRNSLPLFKTRKMSQSALGMLIVVLSLGALAGSVNSLHSQEYKTDMLNHDYHIIDTIEANCVENGKIEYYCEYCGRSKTEPIQATGHTMNEESRIEANCVEDGKIEYRCEYCGRSKIEPIQATGHTMNEESHIEANCVTDGEIRSCCIICGYENIEVIPAVGHTIQENSNLCSICGQAITTPDTYSKSDSATMYDKEILFRDIPWGTSSKEAEGILKSGDPELSVMRLEETYMMKASQPLDTSFFDNVQEAGNWLCPIPYSIAGFDVLNTRLYFHYQLNEGTIDRNNDVLYLVTFDFDVLDYNTVYESLVEKLDALYGTGAETHKTTKNWIAAEDYSGTYKTDIYETVWYGANDTFVMIRCTIPDKEYDSVSMFCGVSMAYGQTSADSILADMEELLVAEQKEQEKNNAESANNDGL